MPEQYVLQTPWALHPTPEVLDEMIQEIVDTRVTGYHHLAEGTPHPDREHYPGFLLVEEKPINQFFVRRVWCTSSFVNQDAYNYGITYGNESNSHPIYARRYLYRRDA